MVLKQRVLREDSNRSFRKEVLKGRRLLSEGSGRILQEGAVPLGTLPS